MAEPVIQIEGFAKTFHSWTTSVDAIRDVSLSVEPGTVVAFVGPNGAGKTTTIYTLLGLLEPTRGSVKLFGEPAGSLAARRRLGFLSEIFYTYPFLTARRAMRLYGGLSGMSAADLDRRIAPQLERLGLAEAIDRKVSSFSKGMVQRLGLAQALLHQPDLLILDEPTTGLDPEGRKLVADIILEQKARGTTVFLSSHILSDVERTCDRVIMIRSGQIVLRETIGALAGEGERWEVEVLGWPDDPSELLTAIPHEVLRRDGSTAVLRCLGDRKNDLLRALLASETDIVAVRRDRKSLEELYMEHVGGTTSG